MSWRRHELNVKTKVSNPEKTPIFCFQAAIWKMKLETLLVCNVREHCLKKKHLYQFWMVLSQWKFMCLCILKVRFY